MDRHQVDGIPLLHPRFRVGGPSVLPRPMFELVRDSPNHQSAARWPEPFPKDDLEPEEL